MHTQQALKPVFASFFLTLASTGAALAHTGADGGTHHGAFMSGLLHPLTGTDHLAAMVAVGIWSAVALRTAWHRWHLWPCWRWAHWPGLRAFSPPVLSQRLRHPSWCWAC
jgi:hydrogenase/urease accessory protein HupE